MARETKPASFVVALLLGGAVGCLTVGDGGESDVGESVSPETGEMTSGATEDGGDGDGDADAGGDGDVSDCGPTTATVVDVIDGDTIEISGGERVRYLLVDTPELGPDAECFGQQAQNFNNMMVYGKTITLTYDAVCRDQYDRLLAYVTVDGADLNRLLVSEGYACVLHFPPNGDDQVVDYYALLNEAFMQNKGMWAVCDNPC